MTKCDLKTTSWTNPLSKGVDPSSRWEVRETEDGRTYYVDHESKTTTWEDPRVLLALAESREDSDVIGSTSTETAKDMLLQMFPTVDPDVVDILLAANNGDYDLVVGSLLEMSSDM